MKHNAVQLDKLRSSLCSSRDGCNYSGRFGSEVHHLKYDWRLKMFAPDDGGDCLLVFHFQLLKYVEHGRGRLF